MGIRELVEIAYSDIIPQDYELIVICGGICDSTRSDESMKVVAITNTD